MKKIIAIAFIFIFAYSYDVKAEYCIMPKFIKIGDKIYVSTSYGEIDVKVIEIDDKSCWIKSENGSWVNIKAAYVISDKKKCLEGC